VVPNPSAYQDLFVCVARGEWRIQLWLILDKVQESEDTLYRLHEALEMSLDDLYYRHDLCLAYKCIWVLDVLLISDSTSAIHAEPIVRTLKVIGLNDTPLFTALSYVWEQGSTGLKVPHHLRGRASICDTELSVRTGASPTKLGQSSIWVDAICLKQND
jgi:hypothetical protein